MMNLADLHHDILLEISQINCNMDEDESLSEQLFTRPRYLYPKSPPPPRAINALRDLSQVCSSWRNLIVHTPGLWANVIDISMLTYEQHYWRKEVIRRTEDALLYVKGDLHLVPFTDTQPWWVDFLHNNWSRIRKLDVLVPRRIDYSRAKNCREALSFLSKPTTSLEIFKIDFAESCNPLEGGTTLFGDDAPQLRCLRTRHMHMTLDVLPRQHWLRHLHHLHIVQRTFASLDSLYQVLSQMNHIERLTLENAIGSAYINAQRPPLHLPRLRSIQILDRGIITTDPELGKLTCWSLLNSIAPKDDCSLDLVAIPVMGDVDIPVLRRFVEAHIQANQPSYLHLAAGPKYFLVTDTLDTTESDIRQQPLRFASKGFWPFLKDNISTSPNLKTPQPRAILNFFFLMTGVTTITDTTICRIFKGLTSLSYPSVTDLRLSVSFYHWDVFLDPELGDLSASFPSVEKLFAGSETLDAIRASPFGDPTVLFPRLKDSNEEKVESI